MVADGTLERGVNDVAARVWTSINVAAKWEFGALVPRPNNAFVAVWHHLKGDVLVWNMSR